MKQATECKLILALVALLASACGKSPEDAAPPPAGAVAGSDAPEEQGPKPSGGPAAWSGLANSQGWTSAVTSVVKANLASFEKARDRETFCPGYAGASLAQRETCWVRLVSAVAQYESAFHPALMFRESNGVYSVGLLQLSAGECSNAPTNTALKDPVQNLVCGTRKMASLIARYGYVTSPDNRHGAAAYWSTLRAPYNSGGMHLGKRNEIARISSVYRSVTPVSGTMLAEE